MTIYDSELNPYSSIEDYTLDGLYTPLVNVEKQIEDTKPKKVTTDVKPKKVIVQSEGIKNALDSKNVVLSTEESVVATSVDSKGAVEAPVKPDKSEPEPVPAKEEVKAEKPNEDVVEPLKKRRGRPRKIQVEEAPKDGC